MDHPASSTKVERGRQSTSADAPQAESAPVDTVRQYDMLPQLLSQAWHEYQEQRFQEARDLFLEVAESSKTESRDNARLGLAYTYLKLDRQDKAIDLLENLVREHYKTEETLPALINILLSREEWKRAAALLQQQSASRSEKLSAAAARRFLYEQFPGDFDLAARLAWSAFRQKEYEQSTTLFKELLSRFPASEDYLLGAAFSLQKLGKDEQALQQLENFQAPLSAKARKTRDDLYVSLNRKAADAENQQEAHALLQRAVQAGSKNPVLLAHYGWSCYERADYPCATDTFTQLTQSYPDNEDYLLGLGYALQASGQNEQAIRRLKNFQGTLSNKANELLTNLYSTEGQQAFEAGKYEKARHYFGQALGRTPHDVDLRESYGWACFRLENFGCAQMEFEQLLRENPGTEKYMTGLVSSLQKQGENKEALAVIEQHPAIRSPAIAEQQVNLYRSMGNTAYKEQDFAVAEKYLTRATQLAPDDEETKLLLLWTRHHMGNSSGLISYLQDNFDSQGSPETAKTVIGLLEAQDMKEEENQFLEKLAQSEDPSLKILAAESIYREVGPLAAAQVYNAPETCYQGCDAVQVHAVPFFRSKKGDNGLSRLDVYGVSTRLAVPWPNANIWSLRLTPFQLSYDNDKDQPYSGQYYKMLQQPNMPFQKNDDTFDVWDIQAGWYHEGRRSYDLRVGMTPENGPIASAPTFSLHISDKKWKLHFEHQPVRESVLSWIGMEDPYSDKVWGRVLRSGLSGGYSFDLPGPYWLYLDAEYYSYNGKDVEGNYSLHSSLSTGRTDQWQIFNRSIGAFLSAAGFDRNSDFYTFGHGGYYSPEFMLVTGPFVSLKTSECKNFWLSGHLSAGYSYRQTEDAPHYHQTHTDPLSLSRSASHDFSGEYQGDSSSGMGVNAQLKGLMRLNDNWFFGGLASVENSNDYLDYKAALVLSYSFSKNRTFCGTERFFDSLMSLF
ncbi:MAG: BCSC C-terminal domain-containing protein [Desulfobulbaceae bacterium]|nr:BCSC C-terminal domain-containing protein [Desulfobulbaceae bacterium]